MGQFIPRTWMTYFDHELGPVSGIGEPPGPLTKITLNYFSLETKCSKFEFSKCFCSETAIFEKSSKMTFFWENLSKNSNFETFDFCFWNFSSLELFQLVKSVCLGWFTVLVFFLLSNWINICLTRVTDIPYIQYYRAYALDDDCMFSIHYNTWRGIY